ncbi:MAG: carbohydrate kinase family protein [Bellilinea sp.]
MNVVITGSIAFDYLMTYPGYFRDHIVPERLDSITLSFLVDQLVRLRGGVAPNIAYTMALLGGTPYVFGTVGEDAGEYVAWLKDQGVDTRFIKTIPGVFTASFFANTDKANNQISSFYTGAMAHARELSINDLGDIKPDLVVISPNDPAAMDRYVAECKAAGIPYLYDPGQQVARSSGEELRRGVEGAQILFVNEYEWELVQKHTGLSAEKILSTVPIVVITLGKSGVEIHVDGSVQKLPAVPEDKIVDPTGVGDAFRGGFLRGYQLGLDWKICCQIGSLAAVYCLENNGPQGQSYTRSEFVKRFRQHFDDQGLLDALMK